MLNFDVDMDFASIEHKCVMAKKIAKIKVTNRLVQVFVFMFCDILMAFSLNFIRFHTHCFYVLELFRI